MDHIVDNLTHRHEAIYKCFSNALNDEADTDDEKPENDVIYNIELAKSAIRDYGEKYGMTEQNVCQLLQSKGIDVLNINAIRPNQVVDIQALLI